MNDKYFNHCMNFGMCCNKMNECESLINITIEYLQLILKTSNITIYSMKLYESVNLVFKINEIRNDP